MATTAGQSYATAPNRLMHASNGMTTPTAKSALAPYQRARAVQRLPWAGHV